MRKRPAAPPTNAVIYVRVSTDEQAGSGLGLLDQEARCRAFCAAQGWHETGIYQDAGVSAKALDRPGLNAALAVLNPGHVLVALKLDRLTRTAKDLDTLTELVDAAGATWQTVEDTFETRTAVGRAMLRIVAVLAQLEREQVAERTSSALRAKQARGEYVGAIPLGWRREPDGAIVEDADGQATRAMAKEMRERGMNLRAIAQELMAAGRRTQRGNTRWAAEQVRGLLVEPSLYRATARRTSGEPVVRCEAP